MNIVMPIVYMHDSRPRELTTQEQEDLRYLFADALSDFIRPRRDAEEYVATRYATGFSPQMLADKRAQVQRRVSLARSLHNTVLNIGFEPSSPTFRDLEWSEDALGWLRAPLGKLTLLVHPETFYWCVRYQDQSQDLGASSTQASTLEQAKREAFEFASNINK